MVLGLVRTGVGDKTVPVDEYLSLVGRKEEEDDDDDAGIPVGLGAVPKSIVPVAKVAVFAVRRPVAVSKVGGTELGLEATDGLSAIVMMAAVMELTLTETGPGDSAAVGVALRLSPSAGLEDASSPAGSVDTGSKGWPGGDLGRTASLEPGPTGIPSEGKGGLVGARGDAVKPSPSPRSEKRKY